MTTYAYIMLVGACLATGLMVGSIIVARQRYWGNRMWEHILWSLSIALFADFVLCLSALADDSSRLSADQTVWYAEWVGGMAIAAALAASAAATLHFRRKREGGGRSRPNVVDIRR